MLEVPGIGRKRAEQIKQAWAEQKSVRAIMVFLQGHGISTGQAAKIYKRYGDGAVAVLRENPYRLAEDIAGIGFAGADKVAESLGVEKTSPQRLQAGLIFALQDASGEGHVCMPEDWLIAAAADLLDVDAKLLPEAIRALESQRQLVRQGTDCYLSALYSAEAGCAHHLKRLLTAQKVAVSIDIEKAIAWVEKQQGIQLSEEQAEALRMAVRAPVDRKSVV